MRAAKPARAATPTTRRAGSSRSPDGILMTHLPGQQIDNRRFICYGLGMRAIKLRPVDCCTPPVDTAPLSQQERAGLVSMFHALGDPTRLEIFRLIATQRDPICVCD